MKIINYLIISAILLACFIILFLIYKDQNKPPYALEIDATKDKTDISGTFYRVKVSNTGLQPLTGIEVILGKNDIQKMDILKPGEFFFFYPKPDTQIEGVKVTTNEGIIKQSEYRSPLKGIGLPGSGR